jgi:hypothetical protein
MLDFRMQRSARHGIRVNVYRRYRDEASKGPFRYTHIGSFLLSNPYDEELISLFEPEELLQFHNWVAEANFAKNLGIEADTLEKYSFRMPSEFYLALLAMHQEAKRLHLNFVPHEIMLDALLRAAKKMQHRIDDINGIPSHILAHVGGDSIAEYKQKALDAVDNPSKRLFQALIDLPQPIGKTCSELEVAVLSYGKKKRIPPPELYDWAGVKASRNPDKRIKKWCYAAAIDVLHAHDIDVFAFSKPQRVAVYWTLQRLDTLDLQTAIKQFMKTFKPKEAFHDIITRTITHIYEGVHNKSQSATD